MRAAVVPYGPITNVFIIDQRLSFKCSVSGGYQECMLPKRISVIYTVEMRMDFNSLHTQKRKGAYKPLPH